MSADVGWPQTRAVQITDGTDVFDGDLAMPPGAAGLVVFAHGSGSSRHSPRNRAVAQAIGLGGFATLLLDLLTREEELTDAFTREFRFDIERLARRVVVAIDWAEGQPALAALPVAIFGASTGAAAALVAATQRPGRVRAVISRGGRPDLVGDGLGLVDAPTLLIVGGADPMVIELNRAASRRMRGLVEVRIVPGATHLFEEPGALTQMADLALGWCRRFLTSTATARQVGGEPRASVRPVVAMGDGPRGDPDTARDGGEADRGRPSGYPPGPSWPVSPGR